MKEAEVEITFTCKVSMPEESKEKCLESFNGIVYGNGDVDDMIGHIAYGNIILHDEMVEGVGNLSELDINVKNVNRTIKVDDRELI